MTLLFIMIGSIAFLGIAFRFASRASRRVSHPYPIR